MTFRTYKGILMQFQVVRVIIVLLSGNLRVLEVLALDLWVYRKIYWIKLWKLKLVGLEEVGVNRKFEDLD